MTKKEANIILSFHLMQCGAMMPIEWVQKNGNDSEFMQAYKMAMDALKNATVMCKDCKHWHQHNGKHSGKPVGYGDCRNPCGINGIAYEDSFCSYGERKDGDKDYGKAD